MVSLPNGECGLKYESAYFDLCKYGVAPQWGVWIEIGNISKAQCIPHVAPQWGVWIEIMMEIVSLATNASRSPMGSVD